MDGKPAKQCISREGSNHARLLPRYIEELLRYAAEQNLSIEAVALSEGPGSYTGLRIGASTAKGLCYGLNIPLIPIPTLQVLCQAAKEQMSNDKCQMSNAQLCPMIDARRMEVYTLAEDGTARAVVVEKEQSLFAGNEEIYYFGDGAAKCVPIFTKGNWHYIPDIVPEAQYMGVLAEKTTNDKRLTTNDQLAYYEPYYLKEFVAAQSHIKGLKS